MAERLSKKLTRLEQWVADLQSAMYVNCVYCGHRYGPDDEVPTTMAQVLKEHIEQCPQHPMSALKKDLEQARIRVRRLQEALKQTASAYHHEEHRVRMASRVGLEDCTSPVCTSACAASAEPQ